MIIRTLFLFLIVTALGFAQTWKVTRMEKITRANDGLYFYPQISTDGAKIFFTTSKYQGLYVIDLKTRQTECLTESASAGYKPVFSQDGQKVYFRKDSYPNRRKRSSLIELDIASKTENNLITDKKNVSVPYLSADQVLVYQSQTSLEKIELGPAASKKNAGVIQPFLYAEDGSLILYQNGARKVLAPLGKGHYIWGSISPNKQKILFTLAGRGTYICDFDGTILYELGTAHAPQWSPDGQWIVYMFDRDDGHQYTGSEIFITSLTGDRRFQVTENGLIAMYPTWSPDGRMITFHSFEGEIYLLQLSYTEESD